MEKAFLPGTVLEILSYLESKLSSDVVQSQSPTSKMPSELGMLRDWGALVPYWEEELCHQGLPQYKKNVRVQHTDPVEKNVQENVLFILLELQKSHWSAEEPMECRLFFLRNNSNLKNCFFSRTRLSKWKFNLPRKNKQLMLFNVK